MPLARTALYAAGEDLHVAIWPGSERNTREITPFIAREGRSFALSVGAPLRGSDIPEHTLFHDRLAPHPDELIHDGGSCIAGPDGEWIVEPVAREECLIVAELNHEHVLEERHNFDAVGHYSRPDVLRLLVNRERQGSVDWLEE